MPVADTAQQRAGGHRTEALQRHQAPAARVFACRLGDEPVVFFDPLVEWAGVRQQVADTLPGMARQAFEMGADLATKAGDLLWQDDAEFGDQPAQPIVGGRAFLDKALPRAVQTPDDPRGSSLTGTKRLCGRRTASQVAAASAASCWPRLPLIR